MDALNLMPRFTLLQAGRPYLRMFALVDGLAFEQLHSERLQPAVGQVALFEQTPDAPLASAGPWLIDVAQQVGMTQRLYATQDQAPYVSWLMTEVPFQGLVQLLQLRLDARLPDGTTALLRFYDPRVLRSLAMSLTAQQREEFFGQVLEWHFLCNGQALRIAKDAYA